MDTPRLYRRRYLPDEIVELKNDTILLCNDRMLITRWNVLKPRKDIDHGISIYYMKEGYKISKIFAADGQLVYWYCDIIDTHYDAGQNAYTFCDLLTDVLIYPDGHVEVVDLEELADMIEKNILPTETIARSLRQTNALLQEIYSGHFDALIAPIHPFDPSAI